MVLRTNVGFVPEGGFGPWYAAAITNPVIRQAVTTNQPPPAPVVYTPPPFLPAGTTPPAAAAVAASKGPFGLPLPLVLGGLAVVGVGAYLLLRKR